MIRPVVVMVVMMVVNWRNVSSAGGDNATDYERLIGALRAANQHHTRPVLNHNQTTTVSLALSPRWVTLDDVQQQMTVDAWAFMQWEDAHLTWSPDDYSGITEVHLDQTDLWLPDVALFNRVGGDDVPIFGSVPVLVKQSGYVMWFPPAHFK
ncbi:Neurotransmitter-gated ion-channel ligand-binding domain, partial [Trinorchestia longiramus]